MTQNNHVGENSMTIRCIALKMGVMALAAPLALLGVQAEAGQVFDASGVWSGVSTSEIHVLKEGHMVMHTNSNYETFAAEDASNPMAGMAGQCFGSAEMAPPRANGQGHCIFATGDGDTAVFQWNATGFDQTGAMIGTWSVVGGVGKFEGMSGGGHFANAVNRETGAFTNTLTGAGAMR